MIHYLLITVEGGDDIGIGFNGEALTHEAMRDTEAVTVELQPDVLIYKRLGGVTIIG